MCENSQEVYFDQYCPLCRHEKCEETLYPCNECLDEFANVNSHKPVNWEEK